MLTIACVWVAASVAPDDVYYSRRKTTQQKHAELKVKSMFGRIQQWNADNKIRSRLLIQRALCLTFTEDVQSVDGHAHGYVAFMCFRELENGKNGEKIGCA